MPTATLSFEPSLNSPEQALTSQLIQGLLHSKQLPEPVTVIETHISWVLLAGEFAYKIKKPVNFQFADLRTLESRRQACMVEFRLNSRLAPDLYLDVVEITGTEEQPEFAGQGPVIDYAVRMRRIEQQALLTKVLERGELTHEHIDDLAEQVARFHLEARVVSERDAGGSPELVEHDVLSNFDELVPYLTGQAAADVHVLRKTARYDLSHFRSLLEKRKRNGFVRECHGDMHLGNMFLSDGRVIVFDGIDFNMGLRCIDIMNEVAFVVMDLEHRGRKDLASRFLNKWLEWTGDYEGLELLPFYLAYRAVVRAKVETLQSQTCKSCKQRSCLAKECSAHLQQAGSYSIRPKPMLFITCGPSGSGKTTGTQRLLQEMSAIRIRSDIERKRINGLRPDELSAGDIYTSEQDDATYVRLKQLAESVLNSGFACIVDATFGSVARRLAMRQMAQRLNVPFFIVPYNATKEELVNRVQSRRVNTSDASEATVSVVEHQLQSTEPLTATEQQHIFSQTHQPQPGEQ